MDRRRLVIPGVLTVAAAAVVAVGLTLSGGQQPADSPDSSPAGQVEELPDPVVPTSSSTGASDAPETASTPTVPLVADDVPVNEPVTPTDNPVPPPGVPYDSDGGEVVPNPPNMGPGEVAPAPPTGDETEHAPPVGQPEIPGDPTAP